MATLNSQPPTIISPPSSSTTTTTNGQNSQQLIVASSNNQQVLLTTTTTTTSDPSSVVAGGAVEAGPTTTTAVALSTPTTSTTVSAAQLAASQQHAQQQLKEFWPSVQTSVKNLTQNDLRTQELPLARIKKIMKLDEDVKMISAEAPVLFAKAAEIFIHELTLRAWIHTEDNKRRTLQRNDIAMAISKYDQFDFLIDIVPRDEIKPSKKEDKTATTVLGPEQVQYYLQLAQQHQQALQGTTGGVQFIQQTLPSGVQTIQLVQSTAGTQMVQQAPQIVTAQPTAQIGQQTVLLGGAQYQTQSQPAVSNAAAGGLQIVQQVVGLDGQIQNIPIQLSASQLQMLRMQLTNQQVATTQGTPLIIQTASVPQTSSGVMTTTQSGAQIIQNS